MLQNTTIKIWIGLNISQHKFNKDENKSNKKIAIIPILHLALILFVPSPSQRNWKILAYTEIYQNALISWIFSTRVTILINVRIRLAVGTSLCPFQLSRWTSVSFVLDISAALENWSYPFGNIPNTHFMWHYTLLVLCLLIWLSLKWDVGWGEQMCPHVTGGVTYPASIIHHFSSKQIMSRNEDEKQSKNYLFISFQSQSAQNLPR